MIIVRRSLLINIFVGTLFHYLQEKSQAFQPIPQHGGWVARTRPLASSVGGGKDDNGPPRNRKGDNPFDDFLNFEKEESENLQRAREYMSDNSLPISFDVKKGDDDDDVEADEDATPIPDSSAIIARRGNLQAGILTEEMIENNPYISVVTQLSPSELISKFTSTAHPRVQNAVRTTILGLIGGLPKMAFETTLITTGQRLASLMFQLQMTGYMFKNAEYRLSLEQSLGGNLKSLPTSKSSLLLTGSTTDDKVDFLKGKVKGKIRVRMGDGNSTDTTTGGIEVDAAAYMSELRNEVSQLRDELMLTRKSQEEALRKDLLTYIRTLPPQELKALTGTVGDDVIVAMKGLVNAVLSGIGEGQIAADTVVEQSSEALAQLCMWQLVIGYNLRTLEVREDFKKSLKAGAYPTTTNDNIQGGAFE
jgi:hypothetical protein